MKKYKLNQTLCFYEDLVSLNTYNLPHHLHKYAQEVNTAGIGSTLLSSIKNFWSENVGGDPVKTIFNMFATGAIRGLVGGPLGLILGGAAAFLGIDFFGALKSVFDLIKGDLISLKGVSKDKIHSATDAVMSSIKKDAGVKTAASWTRPGASNLLGSVIKFILTALLSGAGLVIGANAIKKVINPEVAPAEDDGKTAPDLISKQTKFKLQPNYSEIAAPKPWVEDTINNESSIEALLIQFAKDVYAGLDQYVPKIKASPSFQTILDSITFANRKAQGDNIVIIPPMYKSKKQLVDYFIDEVAK